ncbi:CppA family protein [Streptococcus equi subsp. zooepidemicus]|uniref:CppA N-terminal domain-containing protein n=1 Tax=Streptococcus equi TaxID=1336 RepID=UPI0005BA4CB3|nr:CppA N-terminal domain-containing protein [Streptococcus equi]KIS09635.1 C3-degrading proteinase [Streptococcus equi subsp. zooepidemicus Sz16]MCD3412151.1 CppA family protein [Streptococcus equi subsp. zooepidemicus]MCD3454153.1 CppA family protein [Streptococcus equi subsp. zooepidemicus]MDI5945126.1 CppA N-terminal domain-containing protein [Streptococcus equi subsp. zooepidemicus]MDI5990716.1 CppA N-terminal domain-containing protein [Streptococcus equi subsp. zooepidemicus]
MTLFDNIVFKTPVLRVNNRDLNIAFYQKNLGLRLVSEENAISIFSSWGQGQERFVIEESPAARTRAVDGPKKVNTIVIKTTAPKDIEQLLAHGVDYDLIFKGKKGYAFEVTSPEGDRFLLHAEDDIKELDIVDDVPAIDKEADFRGLSQFSFDLIVLNVLDDEQSRAFYQSIFGDCLPVMLEFNRETGQDLTIAPHVTWDLEILEFQVSDSYDLLALKTYLEDKGCQVYLDKKARVLVLSDPSQIEIWFVK